MTITSINHKNFLILAEDDNLSINSMEDDEISFDYGNEIFITNASDFAFEIEEIGSSYQQVNRHELLNPCCSLLTRSNLRICGHNKQRNFLQRICSTTPGDSIPLLYPEEYYSHLSFIEWCQMMDQLLALYQVHF